MSNAERINELLTSIKEIENDLAMLDTTEKDYAVERLIGIINKLMQFNRELCNVMFEMSILIS